MCRGEGEECRGKNGRRLAGRRDEKGVTVTGGKERNGVNYVCENDGGEGEDRGDRGERRRKDKGEGEERMGQRERRNGRDGD